MTEAKPFASLGPTLLARKGGARPAMRPQLAALPQDPQEFAQDLEDLGWNDMGDEAAEDRRDTVVLALTPAPHHPALESEAPPPPLAPTEPEVLRQQRAIVESIVLEPEPAPQQVEPRAPAAQQLIGQARRAAFTLRLDTKRHLKLRLASTVKNRSAQALVTQALDKFLAEIPELEALASQLNRD
ncbi:MAG: hypothetical protein ABIP24_00875 [Croceibacterium sp.]